MTTRLALFLRCAVGLMVSGVVLGLLCFGVSGVLVVGRTDLMYVWWPTSKLLVVGWRSTPLGMIITAFSVLTNCLLYMALAYALRRVVGFVSRFGD